MKKIVIIIILLVSTLAGKAFAQSQYLQKGFDAISAGNPAQAVSYWKQGDQIGDKLCTGRLALAYMAGLGGEIDIAKAKEYGLKGYKMGNSCAACILGMILAGEEIFSEAEKVLKWAYDAEDAEKDNADIYANVGMLIVTCIYMRSPVKIDGNPFPTGQTQKEMEYWINKVSYDYPSHPNFNGYISFLYYCIDDFDKAAHYGKIADENGSPVGSAVYGYCLAYGKGVAKDAATGFKKVKKAALLDTFSDEESRAFTFLTLGDFYNDGIGTPVSKSDAKEWYKKAADAGNKEASRKLALLNIFN